MKTCPNCDAILPKDILNFCPICGDLVNKSSVLCKGCFSFCEKADLFCYKCGESLKPIEIVKINKEKQCQK